MFFSLKNNHIQAGEQVEMPVSFYVDPEIVTDKSGRRLKEITLSYVFYAKKQPIKAAQVVR